MRNTTKKLALIAMVFIICSCQTYSHVVVSHQSVMDSKTGEIHQVKLDSTFKMYDKVKIVNGVVVKVKNQLN